MPRGTTRGLAGSSTRVVAPRLVGSPPPSARCCLRLACAPCWSVVMLQVAAEAQNCGGGLLEREAHDNLETPRLWTRQICSAFAAPAHLRGLGRRNDNQTKPLGRDRRPAGNSTRPRPPPPAANTAPCMHSCSPRCSPAAYVTKASRLPKRQLPEEDKGRGIAARHDPLGRRPLVPLALSSACTPCSPRPAAA